MSNVTGRNREALKLSIEAWEYVVRFGKKPNWTRDYLARCPMCHFMPNCRACKKLVDWAVDPGDSLNACINSNGLFHKYERERAEATKRRYAELIVQRLKAGLFEIS